MCGSWWAHFLCCSVSWHLKKLSYTKNRTWQAGQNSNRHVYVGTARDKRLYNQERVKQRLKSSIRPPWPVIPKLMRFYGTCVSPPRPVLLLLHADRALCNTSCEYYRSARRCQSENVRASMRSGGGAGPRGVWTEQINCQITHTASASRFHVHQRKLHAND